MVPLECEGKSNYTKVPVGMTPSGIVYDQDNNDIYVTNLNSNSVSVIDGSNDKVISTILVDEKPNSLIYDKYNKLLYVINSNSDNLFVIDTSKNIVVGKIPINNERNVKFPYYPYSITLRSSQNFLYVANYLNNSVSVINGSSNKVIDVIHQNIGTNPIALVYNYVNDGVYVANSKSDNVSIINGATNKVIDIIKVGTFPIALAYDSTNDIIYVIHKGSNELYLINGNKNTITSKIKLPSGGEPLSIAVNPFTKSVFIANNKSNTIFEIDNNLSNFYSNNSLKYSTIKLENVPEHLAINLKNNKIYATSPTSNEVYIIEAKKSHICSSYN